MSINFPAFFKMGSLWMQIAFTYRFYVAMQLLGMIFKIAILNIVWTSIYANAGTDTLDGVTLRQTVVFLTLATLQTWLMQSFVTDYLYGRIREGTIAIDLVRPTGFLGQLIAVHLGGIAGFAPFLLAGIPIAFVFGSLALPATLTSAALYFVSLSLACAISGLFAGIIGLLAFWTTEVWGLRTIFDFVSLFFSGALVPLWFFPQTLRTIASWLPFQTQAHLPLQIYSGQIANQDAFAAIGLQFFWVLVLSAAAAFLWRRGVRRVVVQGG